MAVKTVTGKLTGPSNAAIGGVLVTAQLSASAVIAATQEIAPLAVTTQTATDGTWSLSLQANGDLTPGSTYYTVSVGPNWTATAIVPQTAGPFLIENIMAVAPAAWLGGTAATLNPAGDLAVRSLTVLPSGPYAKSPIAFGGGSVWPGKVFISPSGDTTGVTDRTNILAAMAVMGPIGGTVELMPDASGAAGTFYIDQPLTYKQKTAVVAQLAPSLIGIPGGGGSSFDVALLGPARLKAVATFPLGEFLIDYIGSTSTLNAPLTAFRIEGLELSCQSRAAGLRLANHESSTLKDVQINSALTPAPADNTGSPTAAISCVNVGGSKDSSYNNVIDHVYTFGAANDGFQLQESNSSSVIASNCAAIGSARYNWNVGDNVTLYACDAQSPGTAVANYYVMGATLIGCTEMFSGPTYNSVIVDNPFALTARRSLFIGCWFAGCNTLGTEANSAMVRVLFSLQRTLFIGCSFQAGTGTSDWLYMDAGPSTGRLSFIGCDFTGLRAPLTNKFNFNSNTIAQFRDCPGLNPIGGVTTPGFPATTVAVTNNTGFPVMAYITNGTSPLTLQVDAVTALMVIPASGVGTVKIPPGSSFTPTFAGGVPTWKWYGE